MPTSLRLRAAAEVGRLRSTKSWIGWAGPMALLAVAAVAISCGPEGATSEVGLAGDALTAWDFGPPDDVPYGVAATEDEWNVDSLGNHRALIEVTTGGEGDAVVADIPWRRRDYQPEAKAIWLFDEAGTRIENVVVLRVTREFGRFVFEPSSGPGTYIVYYMPWTMSGRANYPTVEYVEPTETADTTWTASHGLTSELRPGVGLPQAEVLEIQAIDSLNSFYPMEIIASTEERLALASAAGDRPFLVFPEDRSLPIRMTRDIPARWVQRGDVAEFKGRAERGEYYAFQVGVWAANGDASDLVARFDDLEGPRGYVIPSSAFTCFNLEGVDGNGASFAKTVSVPLGTVQPLWMAVEIPVGAQPGLYRGGVTLSIAGGDSTRIPLELEITDDVIPVLGDDEAWRHSRLRWLNSRLGLDDEVVSPFSPVQIEAERSEDALVDEGAALTLRVLGRRIVIGIDGFPRAIESFFSEDMNTLKEAPTAILTAPVSLGVADQSGRTLDWQAETFTVTEDTPGAVAWTARTTAGTLTRDLKGRLEFDGTLDYEVDVRTSRAVALEDIWLDVPMAPDVAEYMLGMGRQGGFRPEETFDWSWQVESNQDGVWLGTVNAGLQLSMRDDRYVRPLNTNFYLSKPLVMPASWSNGGEGGCRLREGEGAYLIRCFSEERLLAEDETQHYDFRLAVTPFKPIDTGKQWSNRFYHRFVPVDSVVETGATVVNVHHANEVNPYINYPFLAVERMQEYVNEGHDKGLKVKIYYTVRELANRAPELFALRSLGDEVIASGDGGGYSWLQEHLDQDYIAGWYVPPLRDAALVNAGVSRWHNYYLEGLDWLARNVEIDGLYIDDVAFDRVTMKRVRKILDRRRDGALIDLHSANQFNPRDGFANSANLYMEHFPYIDRLWFGEYFDYDSPPEFWMTEVAGIPFGLMGEMLQDGGNAWRGMLYGMTARLPWAGDPTALWAAWDEFGIADSRMIGYWVDDAPVTTGRTDVLATTYLHEDGGALVAIASWADSALTVDLGIQWDVLGIDPAEATITASAIEGFQERRSWLATEPVEVPPGRGWLLTISED